MLNDMPKSAFRAIKNSLSSFLGGAEVTLVELEKGEENPAIDQNHGEIAKIVQIDGIKYLFSAYRHELAFTAMERDFISELMVAFEGL